MKINIHTGKLTQDSESHKNLNQFLWWSHQITNRSKFQFKRRCISFRIMTVSAKWSKTLKPVVSFSNVDRMVQRVNSTQWAPQDLTTQGSSQQGQFQCLFRPPSQSKGPLAESRFRPTLQISSLFRHGLSGRGLLAKDKRWNMENVCRERWLWFGPCSLQKLRLGSQSKSSHRCWIGGRTGPGASPCSDIEWAFQWKAPHCIQQSLYLGAVLLQDSNRCLWLT